VFFKLLSRAGASNAMLVTLLVPMTAVLLGNVFLGESIQSTEIIGALIIGSGLLFIDGRIVKRLIR
jgi:drug/metabolite transporter (DMT)-like permease